MGSEDKANVVKVKAADGTIIETELDEDGFLVNPGDWTPGFVEAIAQDEGVEKVTDDHWKIINYLRDYYKKFDSCPPIRMLVKESGYDLKTIYKLFPTGPAKGACRLAGAPKPTGCV